ncbi:hypothetical protein A9O66_28435 [Paraburkholderia caribensis]|uniref:Uncharacterized protein n=1 Tax=Paraburkholderia caribensis TaxID=75105 RepID=A0A9Q6WQ39_9BURK|nr:hypothetical protein A9O66_28435 [Paraburkholderia caribensis]
MKGCTFDPTKPTWTDYVSVMFDNGHKDVRADTQSTLGQTSEKAFIDERILIEDNDQRTDCIADERIVDLR